MEIKKINDAISYIPCSENPLSSEVYFIHGEKETYIFDVGSKEENCEQIEKQNAIAVLSHFHGDHTENMKRLAFKKVYGSKQTAKYVKDACVVEGRIQLENQIEIGLFPSSHAKGCVFLNWNNTYLFVGDALYAKTMGEQLVYNVSLLYETIQTLETIDTKFIVMSHREQMMKKNSMLRFLKGIYEKREQGNPYIINN